LAEVWERFSQPDPASHLWYYKTLAACYEGRVPVSLTGELGRAPADLREMAAAPG
jgi:hypothetical protein